MSELLAPAGNLEKLKVAVNYGAHAVYLSGQKFGLRAASDNFTQEELREGVLYAHAAGVLVYVVLNGFLFDSDLEELPPFLALLDELKVDAVIVSDVGVMRKVKELTAIDLHVSTQASCLNWESALFYKDLGATRIVLGREVSLAEAKLIKEKTGLEIEMFVHGSMCMAYSGNCTISNFTHGRDSNRGGCSHSCRFDYSLELKESSQELAQNKSRGFFMSSKDLNGLEVLDQFVAARIDSLKVEGRMKSPLYAALTSKVYREALELIKKNEWTTENQLRLSDQLNKVPHRSYTSASLTGPADSSSIFDERQGISSNEYLIKADILLVEKNRLLVRVRNFFCPNEPLEVLTFKGENIELYNYSISELTGIEIHKTRPSTLVWLNLDNESETSMIQSGMIIRGENIQPTQSTDTVQKALTTEQRV